jgi:hypothetical protein
MRNAWFDRSAAGSRYGMRRAALAAWAIVFALFAILAVPSLSGTPKHRASQGHVIASLVDRAVQPDGDSCRYGDYDRTMEPAPQLC